MCCEFFKQLIIFTWKSTPCLVVVKGLASFYLKCPQNACFENQKVLRKRKITWIVVFQNLNGMPQSGLTKHFASGKVHKEIKIPTLRKKDLKS